VTRALRRRVDELAVEVTEAAPEPQPWAHLADPKLRLVYVHLALPVPLLEAELAVDSDPRRSAIYAAAERRAPALAAGAGELEAARAAADRGEPLVLPHPPEAIAAARGVLFGAHNIVPAPYGLANRRFGSRMPPVTYDPASLDGAVEVVIDVWAFRMHALDLSLSQLWHNSLIDDGIAWGLRHCGPPAGDEGEP